MAPKTKKRAKKSPAKKSPAKKSPAKKSPAKKSPAKKSPAKKSPAKKSPAKKSPKAAKPRHRKVAAKGGKEAKRSPNTRTKKRKERAKKANTVEKEHKQKLLDAKLSRQRQRNRQMMLMQRKNLEYNQQRRQEMMDKQATQEAGGGEKAELDEDEALNMKEQQTKEDSIWWRFRLAVEDILAELLYFLTVTLRSERTFDWLVFLANNLGLFQEYEINDYGQRLSPRTGRPVLLSLGPFRVVQVVESANQFRTHWDPYIREFLRNSKLTTDCWRANRMAMQVALCMDDTGQIFDMPIAEAVLPMSPSTQSAVLKPDMGQTAPQESDENKQA